MRRWGWPALAAVAVLWAAWAVGLLWARLSQGAARAMDFLPLWLGGRALLRRLDPTDPQVLEQVFRAAHIPTQPGGFESYYPQSAAMLVAPLAYVPYMTLGRPLQIGMLCALLGGGLVATLAVPQPRRSRTILLAALAVGLLATLPISWVMINIGQSNCLLVLLTAVGLWSLRPTTTTTTATATADRWSEGVGGLAVGLGIALKIYPVVLLIPAVAGRRWRLVGIALVVPLLLLGGSLLLFAGPWAGSALGSPDVFLSRAPNPSWAAFEPAWVMLVWPVRAVLVGVLAVGMSAWTLWRPRSTRLAALGALWLAAVGTVLSGSSMPHQAITALPALCWLLAGALSPRAGRWGILAALPAVAALVASGVLWRHLPGALQWLPVCLAVAAGCAVRVASAPRG